MDDLARHALNRGIAAFLAVFLAGSAIVFLVDRLGGADQARSTPTRTPKGTHTPTQKPPPSTPDAVLAWLPGGLPGGFVDDLASLREVEQATVASAGVAWLTRSLDAQGKVVDAPAAPYEIPLDVTVVDVPTFAAVLPGPARRQVLDLQPGQGILSKSSAALRGLGVGATLKFVDGASSTPVEILAVLPDVWVGGYELVVPRATGRDIGVTVDRYALFTMDKGVDLDADVLAAELGDFVPADAVSTDVQVRVPGEVGLLRADDLVLPPVAVKRRFGEFSAQPAPFSPDDLQIDPAWVDRNVSTQTLPVFGTITCNDKMFFWLRKIARKLEQQGASTAVTEIEGCFEEASALADPLAPISLHAWGAAIDVDADLDPAIEGGDQDPRVVRTMERWGFVWGSRLPTPDPIPHHYEYQHAPGSSDLPPAPTVTPSPTSSVSVSASPAA